MSDLRKAAQAILDRWDLPVWESSGPVQAAELMANLRAALQDEGKPVAWMRKEDDRLAKHAWLYKWTSQDDGPAETAWQKGYEAARGVVKIHFDEPPQQQEPPYWAVFEGGNVHDFFTTREMAEEMAYYKGEHATVGPLYTAPPQRPLLTEEEICAAANSVRWSNQYHIDFGRAIERKVRGEE